MRDHRARNMTTEIVGREGELASIHTFLERGEGGPAALVLEGEPGIGKSTLWLAGVEKARGGHRVLSTRPAEAERGLANAGLGDLLDSVLDDVLPTLSAPRRRALEVALLVEEASGDPVDRRALAVAVRSAFEALSDREPVVIAIDDVQWLDPSSSSALSFALRRLDAANVLLLLARRLVEDVRPAELESALGPDRLHVLRVGSLSVGALHRLLRDRLDRTFPRQTLLRIHERSGGNPFFALEVARAIDKDVDPLEPLPVPQNLEELVRSRIRGLPAPTREALGLAAAWGNPSEALLRRAGVAAGSLQAAEAAHVVELSNGTVRFTHPLLSSVLYTDLGEGRRSIHARIADIVDDPVVRARHLALSRDAPDEGIATALDDAVRVAVDRGASAIAAELAEQALRLTPPDSRDQRHRRALEAARAHQGAGEWTRTRTITTELLAETKTGPRRAEALVLLSEIEVDRCAELLEEALREATSRPALQSAIHCRLGWAERFLNGFDHARAALLLADELDDDVLRARARAVQAILSWFAGENEAPEDLSARTHDFPAAVGGEHLVREGMQAVANTFAPSSKREAARTLLEGEHHEWRERDEPRSARALWGLSWVEFWAGRWDLAAEYAARAHDTSIQYGLETPQDHLPIAVIALHRGRLELARTHSTRAMGLVEEAGEQVTLPQHRAVLGLVALWSRDPSGADERLSEACRVAAKLGWGEPSVRWWTADYAELLLELGRIDEAVQVLDAWETDAVRVSREWVFGHVTRSRGLVAAALGDTGRAESLLQEAVGQHEDVGDPYGRARALLALGVLRRRARQKAAAREAIGEALSGFEKLGAATWLEKARRELGSIGGRRREEGLTAAEQRVAALVAEGRTNREVAAALFLAERTVASHLTHIYAKLGIRSRAELARLLPE
jgi:DNA-binding CsgD family transcriptional regulator